MVCVCICMIIYTYIYYILFYVKGEKNYLHCNIKINSDKTNLKGKANIIIYVGRVFYIGANY